MDNTNSAPEKAAKPSALPQLVNIFAAPGQALDYARQHPGTWWLPLGILLVLNAASSLWWTLSVNLKALHLMQLQAMTRLHPEYASQATKHIMAQGRGALVLEVVLGGIIGLVIVELLYALYLFMADKLFSADSRGYGQWFSFATWTGLPAALGFVAGLVTFAVSSKMSLQPIDVTSLNTLFLHLKPANHFYKIARFSILNFWVIGLATYGLKRWCKHSTGKALTIAIVPYVVVYLIMYLV